MAFNEQIHASTRPNIFELFAQESMDGALRPAIQHVCKVVAHAFPERLGTAWKLADELCLAVEFFVQYCYMRYHSGSFSEHFYSLKRVTASKGGAIGESARIISVICLACLPYALARMERLHSDATFDTGAAGSSDSMSGRSIKAVLVKLYPYIHFMWEALKLIFRIKYLLRHTDCYSPQHWMAGVVLVRHLDDSYSDGMSVWKKLANAAFPAGLFTLKLLEWWYSEENSGNVRTLTTLPVPPPPPRVQPSPYGLAVPEDPHICPICLQRKRDPTTISTSGYVFCYSCILKYIRTHGVCPITRVPSSEKKMIRLYLQHS